MKWNPTTTVIPGVDESKLTYPNDRLTEPATLLSVACEVHDRHMSLSSPVNTRRRKLTVRVWLLIVLIVVGVTVPSLLFWSDERMEMHAKWQAQLNLAQTFRIWGLEQAASFVSTPNYVSNNTAQIGTETGLGTALSALYELMGQDSAHRSQLSLMYTRLGSLYSSPGSNILQLNDTQRTTLSTIFKSTGTKIVDAYANYLNYTSSDPTAGPPFWYSGPSPPDESLLQQAIALIVDLPGLPPFQ